MESQRKPRILIGREQNHTIKDPMEKLFQLFPGHHSRCRQCVNLTVHYHKWSAVIYCKSTYGYPTISSHSRINLLTRCTPLSVREFTSATTHFNQCMLALMEAIEGNMHIAFLSGGGHFTYLLSLYRTITYRVQIICLWFNVTFK